jgi:hypothetical protein
VYEVAAPSPTSAPYLRTTTAVSIATVLVRTVIPLPAPTAKSEDKLRPDVVASLISAPVAPVCNQYPALGSNVKFVPVSNTPLDAV